MKFLIDDALLREEKKEVTILDEKEHCSSLNENEGAIFMAWKVESNPTNSALITNQVQEFVFKFLRIQETFKTPNLMRDIQYHMALTLGLRLQNLPYYIISPNETHIYKMKMRTY